MAKVSVSKLVESGSKSVTKSASSVVKSTNSTLNKITKKLSGVCNPESIIPCVTAITIIFYIVVVSPATVLDIFSSKTGKALSMFVVFTTLLFDLKMGVMLGLAVILSISLASVNKDLYESFVEENYVAPIDYKLEEPPCKKPAEKTKAVKVVNKSEYSVSGVDDHLSIYAPFVSHES